MGTTGPRPTVSDEKYNRMLEEEKWKAYPTLPIRDFFEYWTRLYFMLVWMVITSPDSGRGPGLGRFYSRTSLPNKERRLAS